MSEPIPPSIDVPPSSKAPASREDFPASGLLEDWPFPLFQLDAVDVILWANQAAQEWLNVPLPRLIGRRIWDVLESQPDSSSITQKARENRGALTMRDVTISHRGDGAGRLSGLTAYMTGGGTGLSVWPTGPQPRASKIGGDVVSGMGRMIAHELKNPLAGIKGAAQLLRTDVKTEEGLALIDLIGSEIDRVGRLVDRIESLGDVDPTEAVQVNIHEILRQARRNIQSANPKILFTERYDPSLPLVSGHSDTLMQALLNLIKNAADACAAASDGGEITLETRFRAGVKGGGVKGEDAKNLPVQIRIIDNGSGIEADRLAHIFQPFVTSKSDGQGLGLVLVSKVALAHGGLVEVQSAPGRTVFSLLLPAPTDSANI